MKWNDERVQELMDLISQINCPPYDFLIDETELGELYLQIAFSEIDETVGHEQMMKGRKFLLSPFMVDSEVVQTALLAALTASEHEIRERFTYRGVAIYGPHFDADSLVEFAKKDDAYEYREEPVVEVVDELGEGTASAGG